MKFLKAILFSFLLIGTMNAQAFELPSSGDSSLFLTAYDPASGNSIVADTGLNFSDFLAVSVSAAGLEITPLTTVNYNMTLSAIAGTDFSTVFGTSDTVEWSLIAGDSTDVTAPDALPFGSPGPGISILTTVDSGPGTPSTSAIGQALQNTENFFDDLDVSGVNVVIDGDLFNAPNGNQFGNNFGGVASFGDNTNLVGEAASIYAFTTDCEANFGFCASTATDPAIATALNLATVSFDGTNLVITAVPLPAAVWLFGGALAGLFGFSRRKALAA